jgi:hypothetical protein
MPLILSSVCLLQGPMFVVSRIQDGWGVTLLVLALPAEAPSGHRMAVTSVDINFRKMLEYYLDEVTAVSFQILSNSSCVSAIRYYICQRHEQRSRYSD